MSKPFFIDRPTGLFCRFLVPVDLRALLARRFIVRKLYTSDRSQARLIAAILAIAFMKVFARLRHGEDLDIEKILGSIDATSLSNWEAKKLTLPGGIVIEGLKIKDDADQARFNSLFEKLGHAHIATPVDQKGGMLGDRIVQFLTERKKGELSEKNLADASFALHGLLLPLVGNKRLNDVDSDDADVVMKALLQWPSNASKKPEFKGLSVSEIIEKAIALQAPTLGARTVEKYLDRLRAFFNWCDSRSYLTGSNPFSQRRLMTKDKRGQVQKVPFDDADLARIFAPELRKTCDAPHKYWVPLIALFTGARLNEIAQLYVDDIYESGGVWLFKIIADKPDKKVKNKASERAVPVHQTLLDLRFLEYVQDVKKAGFDRLFPNLPASTKNGYGDAVGDWFNGRHLRSGKSGSKVLRAGIDDPKKTFHSLRYSVINRLYSITKERLLVAEISGHERGDDVLTNVYLDPLSATRRSEILNQLTYRDLTFDPYESGMYDGLFLRLSRRLTRIN